MKRFLKFLATFSIIEAIGRYPVVAGSMALMGVGSVIVSATFTPPANIPQPTAFINNGNGSLMNNGLKPNGGTAGAFEPPTTVANSTAILVEGSISTTPVNTQYLFGEGAQNVGLYMTGSSPGLPTFLIQKAGTLGAQWWNGTGLQMNGTPVTTAGGVTSYNGGYYPFTATGGGCAREPSGIFGSINAGNSTQSGGVDLSDPGFLCFSPPTLSLTNVPNIGAAVPTGAGSVATTCVSHSPITGEMTVTAHVAIPHGLVPGQTYTMQGFTPSGYNVTATPFYTALAGTTGTTIVGETTVGGGICPAAVTSEGTVLGGATGTVTFAAIAPAVGGTGITAKPTQNFCAAIIENGADSSFPGSQAIAMVDDKGNPLPGSPALDPYLNQGTALFNGYIVTTGNPALIVTSMIATTITGATWTAASGITPAQVTFTTSTAPQFLAGSEFTVSGMTPAGYNGTYVAVGSVTTASTTFTATPLSAPFGAPQALSNPGTATGFGSLVSVIMPNMRVYGSNLNSVNSVIQAFGTSGGTGIGGPGSYSLATAPTSFGFGFSVPSSGILTIAGATIQTLTIGTNFTGSDGAGATSLQITGFGTGTGLNGTYQTNYTGGTGGTHTFVATTVNGVGSSGAPVALFAAPQFYQTSVGVAGTGAGSLAPPSTTWTETPVAQATIGDFMQGIGTENIAVGNALASPGWSGKLANVAELVGAFPTQTGGAPSTAALAGLCKKNPSNSIPQFAAAQTTAGNTTTVRSWYPLNDLGIFADAGVAQFTGSIATTTLTIGSTQSGATTALANGTVIAGAGITGCPSACPTISSGSGSSYTLSASGGTVASEAMTAGAFKPATPTTTSTITGYIDNSSGPTLHATALNVGAFATFTGSLNDQFTASIASGCGGGCGVLTVTSLGTGALLNSIPVLGIGTTITIPGGTPSTDTITAVGGSVAANSPLTGAGFNGTYHVSTSQTVASETMFASGLLPGPAQNLNVSGTSGTIAAGMLITDGGANINPANPLQIVGGTSPNFSIVPTYMPTFSADATMIGTQSTLVPGQYVLNSAITIPTKILSYGSNTFGLLGSYSLSACPNVACAVGSSGSPVTITTTAITDAAPVPTPALAVKDVGPGAAVPVINSTISCSALGSCTGTGSIPVSGTFDTSVLGGTPTTIQAQVSLTANGPSVPGCSACAWTSLSGYTAVPLTLQASITTGGIMTPASNAPVLGIGQAFTGAGYSGTVTGINYGGPVPTYNVTPSPGSAVALETMTATSVFSWSGQALNIPAASGPLYVSVRANNGTAYAAMDSAIRVGLAFEHQGEGQIGAVFSPDGGNAIASFVGLLGNSSLQSGIFQAGPPIVGALTGGNGIVGLAAFDRFSVTGVAQPEGSLNFQQTMTNAFGGWPTAVLPILRDGVGIEPELFGNAVQTQTVGVGDGSTTEWCSRGIFCSNPSVAGQLTFNGALLSGAQIVAAINDGSGGAGAPGNILSLSNTGSFTASFAAGVMTVTTTPTNSFQIVPGVVLTGAGVPANTTVVAGGSGTGGIGSYNVSAFFSDASRAYSGTITAASTWLGALEPGMVLSDTTGNITGSPTLQYCISGCSLVVIGSLTYPQIQTWRVSGSAQNVATERIRADAPQSGGTPWPLYAQQKTYPIISSFGSDVIKAGTFKISVGGTVLCQDNTPRFTPYNNQGGNCVDGSGNNLGWVNYQTDDYDFKPLSAPTSGAPVIASWTHLVSPDNGGVAFERPGNYDFFGDGTPSLGAVTATYSKSPAGVNAHIFAGGQGPQLLLQNPGYPYGVGYTQAVSWLYNTRFPNTIPGTSANEPVFFGHNWRAAGATLAYPGQGNSGDAAAGNLFSQWVHDVATPVTFTGTITGVFGGSAATLTLTSNAVGNFWGEGMVLGCVPYSVTCPLGTGAYIESLSTGAMGASGSTYNILAIGGAFAPISATSSPIAMTNAMAYTGAGGGVEVGPYYDQNVQENGGVLTGFPGVSPHGWAGQQGMGRVGRRMAALTYGGLTSLSNASDPFLDRVAGDAPGCDIAATAPPCFDVGTASTNYATTATATNATTLTLSFNGLPAHTIPISDGLAVACSGCATGLVVTSVDHPPTQDTRAHQGQIGSLNNFIVTLNKAPGVGTGHAFTFGCETTGPGSNCVDIAFTLPTTGATSLATCGENNSNGNVAGFSPAGGFCQTNGIGSLVRGFIIGPQQAVWGGAPGLGSGQGSYDDGLMPGGSVSFNRNQSFTCHIVAAKIVQCVLGPNYSFSAGVPTITLGQWQSNNTFIEYGDNLTGGSRISTLMGYVGGQSFPITSAGSGQTPNTYSSVAPVQATAASGVYTSSTGDLALTFATAPFGASIGSTLNGDSVAISGLLPSGTGTALNGYWPITSTATSGTVIHVQAPIGAGSLSITAGSGTLSGCVVGGSTTLPHMDLTVGTGGTLIDAYPAQTSASNALGLAIGSGCIFVVPTAAGGTPGSVAVPLGTIAGEGTGGIGDMPTDNNYLGDYLYDNSMVPGGPLAPFQVNCPSSTGYCEPGLPALSIGLFLGPLVTG